MWQQLGQADDLVRPYDHLSGSVSWIYLRHELSAAPTRRPDGSGLIDRHNQLNGGLSGFEHLRDRGMLGAEPETTRRIDAHTGVDMTGGSDERRRDIPGGAVVAWRESACEFGRRRDEFSRSQRTL